MADSWTAALPASTRVLLRDYVLQAPQTSPVGGQLTRRKGQSLEFQGFAPYTPGDDTRFIDWTASARVGGPLDLVVRSFMAEEHVELVVSVDARESMRFPHGFSKLQIAVWLADAFTATAQGTGDQVAVHPLFASTAAPPRLVSSEAQVRRAVASGGRLESDASLTLNAAVLRPHLPPTSVWVIITDLYFSADDVAVLARAMREAQANMCWVILLDLDSWGYESARLDKGVWRIAGPALAEPGQLVDVDDVRAAIEADIDAHKAAVRMGAALPDIDYRRWSWPDPRNGEGPEPFFNRMLLDDRRIGSIFGRSAL